MQIPYMVEQGNKSDEQGNKSDEQGYKIDDLGIKSPEHGKRDRADWRGSGDRLGVTRLEPTPRNRA
jgi:hypothetical protein